MPLSGEASHADCARNSVRSNLHRRAVMIFVGDHRGDGPGLHRVTRWERSSAFEKFASLTTRPGSRPLADFFENVDVDQAINQRFSAEETGFLRAVVTRNSTDQIKSPSQCAQAVSRSRITNDPAGGQLIIELGYLIASHAIGSNQLSRSSSYRGDPSCILRMQMKRRRPDRLLIAQDIAEEFMLERRRW